MKIDNITLVKPPIRVPKGSYSTLRCPPLALAYLGAAARKAGYSVTIIDSVGEAPQQVRPLSGGRFMSVGLTNVEIVARIPQDVHVLGVTCSFSEEWPVIRPMIQALAQARPHAIIIAGGEHISAAPEFSMRDCPVIDYCVRGEGEETLVELLSALECGDDIEGIDGIAWMEQGQYRENNPRTRILDLDTIPRPAWDLVPLENYLVHGYGFGIGRARSVPILATRGCPYQCTFCSSPQMWTTRWSARNPDAVLDEMGWAIKTYGAENFDFYDLTAIIRKDWLLTFCERLIQRNYNITWQIPSGTRSEALDAETLPLLYRAGCRYLPYAPESGSSTVLKRIKKRVKLDRMKESMHEAVRAGLSVKCNVIVGFPGETTEEALETIRFCWDLAAIGVDDVNVGPFCPYPGSELFDSLKAQGKIGEMNDDFFDMLAMYSDLSRTNSWSENIKDRELTLVRYAAMGCFYSRAFARRPQRVASLLHNVYTGKHQNRLDRAVGDIVGRWSNLVAGSISR